MVKYEEVCGVLWGFGGLVESGVVLGINEWGGGVIHPRGKKRLYAPKMPRNGDKITIKSGGKITPARYSIKIRLEFNFNIL